MVRAEALLRGLRAIRLASAAAAGLSLAPLATAQDTAPAPAETAGPEDATQTQSPPAEVSNPAANAPGAPPPQADQSVPGENAQEPSDAEIARQQRAEAQPAAQDRSVMTMLRDNVMLLILGLVILLAIPVLLWARRKFTSDNSRGARRNSPVKLKGDDPMPPFGKSQDPAEVFANFQRQIEELRTERDQLRKRVEELEAGGEGAAPDAAPAAAAASANVYDRKNDRVHDPEDPHRGAPPPPERPSAEPASVAAETPATAPLASSSGANNARDLVDKFNSATKPGDFTRLAESVKAQYYTNERSTDITTLIKSDIDRFWVVPNPNNSNEALLLPGFNLKKSWQKYRQEASDHPLAHHFEMQRGDKLSVIRPAVLMRDSNNEWKLKDKGAISGLS